jgi:hypothetical protein
MEVDREIQYEGRKEQNYRNAVEGQKEKQDTKLNEGYQGNMGVA